MSQPNLPTAPQQPAPQPDSNAQQQQQSPVQAQAQTYVPTSPTANENTVSLVSVITAITTCRLSVAIEPTTQNVCTQGGAGCDSCEFVTGRTGPVERVGYPSEHAGHIAYPLRGCIRREHRISRWGTVAEFCRTFVPEHARYTPERVTLLANGIPLLAEAAGNCHRLSILNSCSERDLNRHAYRPDISPAALPVLAHPITTIDASISDLHYNDNLVYHYAGGMAYAALKRWAEAQEFFEICACSPGSAAAAIQMEALKKLVLVQLIHEGKATPPPKYIHPVLPRLLKGTPYSAFVNAYPDHRAQLRSIVEGELVFATVHRRKRLGLVLQALERAPRWSIRKLTATYLTLHLSDIAHAVGIENVEEVRALILDMIASSEISARLSADGTVSFFDPLVTFAKTDVDRVLAHAQGQAALLGSLEREMARSKEYLTKAVKGTEETSWGAMDDDLGDRLGPGLGWADDIGFP
ncbi:hypothetical protein J3R83DRAFT_10732 [Lanmaoa asiatica]|nr:hypothetical protein J3R83DRAFT_10732 [Lanmaoa asiatica]